jgi:cytidine deaminase
MRASPEDGGSGAQKGRAARRSSRVPGVADGPPEILIEAAARAARRAAALHPTRARGASLLLPSGEVVSAPEVPDAEGAGIGACAERTAVIRAVASGHRRFLALLIRGARGQEDGGPPCGSCLQVLYEFAPDARVWWGTRARPRGGVRVRDLLPGAFGSGHLRASRKRVPDPAPAGRRRTSP